MISDSEGEKTTKKKKKKKVAGEYGWQNEPSGYMMSHDFFCELLSHIMSSVNNEL